MKNILITLFLLLVIHAYGQNDCGDAVIICGDNNFNNLNATGIGVQELNDNNSCHGIEDNSIWLKVAVKTGGTLGFVITPSQVNDLTVDFDFWVFGPANSCDDLGHAIRCSTTNPLAAGLSNNTTGMSGNATDTTQGPGEDGNGYVQWLYTNDDDVYYVLINRPIGVSNFSLKWTGTAKFHEPPLSYNSNEGIIEIKKCDADGVDDGATLFDLTTYESIITGPQTNINITYHTSPNDMITGENAITNPQAYTNTFTTESIYLRITNTVSGCYSNQIMKIMIVNPEFPGAPKNLVLCDEDGTGFRLFDLWENNVPLTEGDANVKVTYYATQQDAIAGTNALTRFYTNTLPYAAETLWARMEYYNGCFGYQIKPFTLTVPPLASFAHTLDITDFNGNNNSVTVNMNSGNGGFEFSQDGVSFTDTNTFEYLTAGIHTFYVRDINNCDTVTIDVPILSYPLFFTPNGDSYNETWNITFLSYYYPNAYITIFDRYGNLITGYRGREMGWDGTLNGKPLPASDYWFVINLSSERTVKGHFSLIR